MRAPKSQFISVVFVDETVAILNFVLCEYAPDGSVRWEREPTRANIDAELARHREAWDVLGKPAVRDYSFIDPADIPEKDYLRNAWREGFSVDMPHARELHRDRIRTARAPRLAALDAAFQQADETGDEQGKERVVAEKKALRDAPNNPAIEEAQTPEALRAVWPSELGA
jgi:hypothetical protein